MGITLILAVVVALLSLGVGLVVGRLRGALAGIAAAFGVLAAGVIAYVALVASTAWM